MNFTSTCILHRHIILPAYHTYNNIKWKTERWATSIKNLDGTTYEVEGIFKEMVSSKASAESMSRKLVEQLFLLISQLTKD